MNDILATNFTSGIFAQNSSTNDHSSSDKIGFLDCENMVVCDSWLTDGICWFLTAGQKIFKSPGQKKTCDINLMNFILKCLFWIQIQMMESIHPKKKFREIDSFHLTSFFGIDIFS